MELRILGALELVIDSAVRRLPAGANRQCGSCSRSKPDGSYRPARWWTPSGARSPANASNVLQWRVSRLRKALGDAGLPDLAVITRRPGYVLDVDPERVDAHRFVRHFSGAPLFV